MKAEIRREMRDRLRGAVVGREEKSRAIVATLLRHATGSGAKTLGLFHALPEEPEVALLWEKFTGRVAYPRVVGEALVFVEVRSPAELLPADWHPKIREPAPDSSRVIAPAEMDALLVPGLAFTRAGQRLGRGGGYYDRLLAQLPAHVEKLGVCFELQLVENLPLEAHDQPVDAIVTENGILRCKGFFATDAHG